MELNMGPQHPATHGVLRLLLKTDGEIVYEVTPVLGYLHRCAEKIAEGVNYKQWVVYTDRFDYLAPVCCNHAYVTAVEKLWKPEIPERAEYLRVITAELSRIASHLIALGTFGLDMGAWTPLLYCFREREEILNLLERIGGGRMLYNYMVPGGVRYDIPDDKWIEDVLAMVSLLETKEDQRLQQPIDLQQDIHRAPVRCGRHQSRGRHELRLHRAGAAGLGHQVRLPQERPLFGL